MLATGPEILANSRVDNRAELSLKVSEDHPWFSGHFPQVAIFPGAGIVSWAVMLGQHCFSLAEPKDTAGALKFQALVRPGDLMAATLEWVPEKQRLIYQFRQGEQSVASGWLQY